MIEDYDVGDESHASINMFVNTASLAFCILGFGIWNSIYQKAEQRLFNFATMRIQCSIFGACMLKHLTIALYGYDAVTRDVCSWGGHYISYFTMVYYMINIFATYDLYRMIKYGESASRFREIGGYLVSYILPWYFTKLFTADDIYSTNEMGFCVVNHHLPHITHLGALIITMPAALALLTIILINRSSINRLNRMIKFNKDQATAREEKPNREEFFSSILFEHLAKKLLRYTLVMAAICMGPIISQIMAAVFKVDNIYTLLIRTVAVYTTGILHVFTLFGDPHMYEGKDFYLDRRSYLQTFAVMSNNIDSDLAFRSSNKSL